MDGIPRQDPGYRLGALWYTERMAYRRTKFALAGAAVVAAAVVVPTVATNSYPYAAPEGLVASASTHDSLSLAWKPVQDAPRYRLRYSTYSDMRNSKYKRSEGPQVMQTITGLTKGTTYYVKVRVITEEGDDLSAYSSALKTATKKYAIDYPTDLLADSIVKDGATLRWNAVQDGPRYRVALSTDPNMAGATYHYSDGPVTSLKVTGLRSSINYFAKVRVVEADGSPALSYYSPAHPFTTAAADVEPTPDPTTSPPPPSDGRVTKVLIIPVENKGFNQIANGAPFIRSMGDKHGTFTAHKAWTHPSLPNYMVWGFGSTQGVSSNISPGSKNITAPTVYGGAIRAGYTAKVYADGMPSNCYRSDGGTRYSPRHVEWTHADSETALCKQFVVPYASNFAADARSGNFPNVGEVVPNNCNNSHDCSIRTADEWFKARWSLIEASPDWKSGRLMVIFTADEDNKAEGNRVYTAVIHPAIKGKRYSTPINHASISRLLSDVGHSPRLVNAKTAPDILTITGLKVG
jgi:acid phosphatase